MTEERIKLEDDDFIFSDYYSDRILICDHDKRLQILQDHEIVNRLRELLEHYDFNDGLFYEKVQKIMEESKV